MPQRAQRCALPFSSYHGKNVLRLNDYIVKANYEIAHGQFLLQHPLVPGQTFDLDIRGKGIIKFRAFHTKSAAENWIHSRSPLGKGSIRIRTKNLLQCKVSVPTQDGIVLSTKGKHRQNRLAGSVLAFDIEYGDLVVMVLNGNNQNAVQFDTSCHSRHIEIVNASKVCHASLNHYNPTSLCTPKKLKLSPGQLFKLEVRGPDDPRHTGSYVRVCVSGLCNEYSNGIVRCEGTRVTPELVGRRLMIRPERTEVFVIRVLEDGVRVERGGDPKYFLESPTTRHDLGLWFEMHNVEMRIWLLRAKRDGEAPSMDDEPPPPEYPAPPPPRQVRRRDECSPLETDCCRSTGQRGFTCQHALGESSSLSSDDSCRFISFQRDDTDTSSYVTVDSCVNHDCSCAPDSDETVTPGMLGSESFTAPPPLPPKPCTGKFGGQNQGLQRCGETCLEDFGYIPMRSPVQEPSERCSLWVSRQSETLPTHCLPRRAANDRTASSSEESSYFIHYSLSLRHELEMDFPGDKLQGNSPQDNGSPVSSSGSFSSMSSFSSFEDFRFSQEESISPMNAAPETKPVPCLSRRQRNSSLESTSQCSEMSIDEETDRKTLSHHKSNGAASSCESKSQDETRNRFWGPWLQTQSSTESESEERISLHQFLGSKKNELSKDDITLRPAPTPHMKRNIVESSIINASQDSPTATIEDGPICILPKSEILDRSPTIKRNLNLNDETNGGEKFYNSK